MTEFDGEPEFEEHKEQAGEAFCTAVQALTDVRAYVLRDDELEKFKQAQMNLRKLHQNFDEDHVCSHLGGVSEDD